MGKKWREKIWVNERKKMGVRGMILCTIIRSIEILCLNTCTLHNHLQCVFVFGNGCARGEVEWRAVIHVNSHTNQFDTICQIKWLPHWYLNNIEKYKLRLRRQWHRRRWRRFRLLCVRANQPTYNLDLFISRSFDCFYHLAPTTSTWLNEREKKRKQRARESVERLHFLFLLAHWAPLNKDPRLCINMLYGFSLWYKY